MSSSDKHAVICPCKNIIDLHDPDHPLCILNSNLQAKQNYASNPMLALVTASQPEAASEILISGSSAMSICPSSCGLHPLQSLLGHLQTRPASPTPSLPKKRKIAASQEDASDQDERAMDVMEDFLFSLDQPEEPSQQSSIQEDDAMVTSPPPARATSQPAALMPEALLQSNS